MKYYILNSDRYGTEAEEILSVDEEGNIGNPVCIREDRMKDLANDWSDIADLMDAVHVASVKELSAYGVDDIFLPEESFDMDVKPGEWCDPKFESCFKVGAKTVRIGLYREPDDKSYTLQIYCGDDVIFCKTAMGAEEAVRRFPGRFVQTQRIKYDLIQGIDTDGGLYDLFVGRDTAFSNAKKHLKKGLLMCAEDEIRDARTYENMIDGANLVLKTLGYKARFDDAYQAVVFEELPENDNF